MEKMKNFFSRIGNFIKKHKWSSLLVVLAIMVAGFSLYDTITAGGISYIAPKIQKKPPKPQLVRAPLSGLMVTKEVTERRPIGVVVENHFDARPQSGLNDADLVYETFAEGGITRFLAFYQSKDSKQIGPVRSARTYFVDWVNSYKAMFAHVGGNQDALDMINPLKILDLNQFYLANYFWRDNARYAPHNVYTTTEKLRQAGTSKGYDLTDTTVPSFSFKDDVKADARPANFSFTVDFNPSYAVTYNYSQKDNNFTRTILGQIQTDRVTSAPVVAKNVIVCDSDFSYGTTRIGEQTVHIRTTGSGTATMFIDGTKTVGTWSRSNANITRFYDANGKEVKLNAGTTWIDFVPTGTAIR